MRERVDGFLQCNNQSSEGKRILGDVSGDNSKPQLRISCRNERPGKEGTFMSCSSERRWFSVFGVRPGCQVKTS